MSAIDKMIYMADKDALMDLYGEVELVAAARAELAALRAKVQDEFDIASGYHRRWQTARATVEVQAKQIETMRETLKECRRLVGIYDIVPLIDDALTSLPPSDMRPVPAKRFERMEKLLREAKGTIEQLRDVQNGCPLPSYEQAFALTNGEADKLILAIAAELEERP